MKHYDHEVIRRTFDETHGPSRAWRLRAVCEKVGCSPGTAARAVKGRSGVRLSKSPTGPAHAEDSKPMILHVGHPATIEKRTLFPTMVRDVGGERLLKPGENSGKIGRVVTKGPWKGFPIYTLTLEERATCPTSCRSWASCYGNHMPFARRFRHGADLEWRLEREVAALELDHPRGFAVRLHSLGDFYSVRYVKLWRRLLKSCKALHVFGYTARIDSIGDEIAYELALLVRDYWVRMESCPRFAVRFSNAPVAARSTITLESPVSVPDDAILCPVQWTPSGKRAEACGSCGLCWNTWRRIAFLIH